MILISPTTTQPDLPDVNFLGWKRLILAKGLQFIQWASNIHFQGLHVRQTQIQTQGMKNHQLSSRNDLSGTKSICAECPCVTHWATACFLKLRVEKFCSDFKFSCICFRWHHKLTSSDFLPWLSQLINILEVHQLLTLILNLSLLLVLLLMKARESKFKTKVEEKYMLTNCSCW